jgi:signal transduction histidine kinase
MIGRVRLAWSVFGAALVLIALALVGSVATGGLTEATDPIFVVFAFVFLGVGALLSIRRPDNMIGWIFLSTGLGVGLVGAFDVLASLFPAGSIAARVADWLEGWTWVPLVFVPTIFPLLLFPDGRLPSPRWRPVVWVTVIGIESFSFSIGFDTEASAGAGRLGIEPPAWLVRVTSLGSLVLIAALIGGIVAVVRRFRRSSGEECQQLKWLATGGVAAGVCLAGGFVAGGILTTVGVEVSAGSAAEGILNAIILIAVLLLPASMSIAILKYRLFAIDIVIRKTVVYAVLAGLIFLVGALLVRLVTGVLVGGRGGDALLLTGILIGLLVWPLRRLALRIADRLVFGGRASPYEVLTRFSDRVRDAYVADDVLERMAHVLAAGVGADAATVWLKVGSTFAADATWPADARAASSLPSDAVEVQHQGEVLGALSVSMPASDPMTPAKDRIVRDLAAQAGLVLRNARLIADLRASRQRLVAAQDEERRRLERNIHDGAQQQLVALAVKQRLAASLVGRDDDRLRSLLTDLQSETNEALEDLRDLARGIYPPLLADKGLSAALESQARKSAVPVRVEADEIGRYPQETEAAVYFSALEALQNIAKYAEASEATVRLAQVNGTLTFEVADDGRGFDPEAAERGTGLQGMADRIAALGGDVEIRSAPGDGTTVIGRVPLQKDAS